jgi:ABC-2 type transport system permease protein
MFSVILAPMIMFGCTYYPWVGLERVPGIKYIVLINPLVYVSEGMRAALTPAVPHMPIGAMLAALVAISVLFLWLGIRAFDRRAIS